MVIAVLAGSLGWFEADRDNDQSVGAENLIRLCEQDEWIEAMECVNSTLAMSGDVLVVQTYDPTLGRTR